MGDIFEDSTVGPNGEGLEIRQLCEDEGCPHYGKPHVCIDRQAETIPDSSYLAQRDEACRQIVELTDENLELRLRKARAETRIEVLEAALRKISRYHHDTCDQMLSPGAGYACSCGKAEADAALAVPSGEKEENR